MSKDVQDAHLDLLLAVDRLLKDADKVRACRGRLLEVVTVPPSDRAPQIDAAGREARHASH